MTHLMGLRRPSSMSWSRRTKLVLVALAIVGCGGGTTAATDGGADGGSESGVVAPAERIACGFWRACVLRSDGTVSCWGDAVADSPSGTFSKLAVGVSVCGLRSTGDMECWGWGTFDGKSQPGRYTELSINIQSACATKMDGSVSCWYWTGGGGIIPYSPPPVPVRRVVAGEGNPCGLQIGDSAPLCWGDTPPAPAPKAPAVAVGSGGPFACAIMEGASNLACWGVGNSGETNPPPGSFTSLAVSRGGLCAQRTDGTLTCWGAIATYMPSASPSGVFKDFCIGDTFGCGIHTDGSLACWGYETHGQTLPPPR